MRKYYKMILVLMISFFSTAPVISAQEVDMMLFNRDVNGVAVGTLLHRARVIEKFGEPTSYKEQLSEDNEVSRWYYYGKSYIHTQDDIFDQFAVRDTNFTAFTNHISGGLKVGDPLSKLDNFKYGKPIQYRETEDSVVYRIFNTTDSPVDLYVKNGFIIDIVYLNPM